MYLCPLALLSPELLALAPLVIADQRVCRVQDIAGRPVILFQPDGFRAGILLFKFQDIGNRRAPEFIDRLVVVADYADVLPPARKQRAEHILGMVGVLVFIHKDVTELTLVVFAHIVIRMMSSKSSAFALCISFSYSR